MYQKNNSEGPLWLELALVIACFVAAIGILWYLSPTGG